MDKTADLTEIKAAFERDGYLKIENVLTEQELQVLRKETKNLLDGGWEGKTPANHYGHVPDPITGDNVFNRVQFIFPKAVTQPNPYLALLGHPAILRIIEKLLEGYDYVLTGEALVFKMPHNGAAVPMHTDGAKPGPDTPPGYTYFNVDIYLDDATLENGCLLVGPGSHKTDCEKLVREAGYDFPGLIPVPMKAGDVLFHNTRVVHGSKRSESPHLRRTIYYEFSTTHFIFEYVKKYGYNGIPGRYMDLAAWVEDRAKLILHGIELRKTCSYAAGEPNYVYNAPHGASLKSTEPLDLVPSFGGNAR